ncbi:Tetratricopeptide (TPR) repeat containing protein, partial [Candidatus Methanophagaceae archaeon]
MVEDKEKRFDDILSSIDSEEEVRAKVKKIPDEVKTQFFDRFSQKIFSIEAKKKALIVCDICIDLAIEIKDDVRLYQSYLQRGLSNISLGFKKKAREDLNKAIEVLPSLGVDTSRGVICSSPFKDVFMWLSDLEYMMGSDVEINGQQNKALEHYRNALNTLLTLLPENKEGEAWYFEKLGAIYASMGDFDNSIKNYSRALKCPELLKRNKKRYEIYIGMGLTYQNWGKFLEAEKSFNLAVDSGASIGDNEAQANGYLNLASLYFSKLNRFEDARICLDKVKEKTKNPLTSSTALQIKSGVNLAFGLYQEALACNEKVAEYYQSIGDIRSEAFALSSAASDLSLMGKNEEAVGKLNDILNLYTKLNDKRQIINTHYQIAQEKSVLGDYEAALDALNQALVIASEIENPSMEANSFLLMGSIHLYRTLSLMVAEACYSRALDKSCEANNQYFEVQSLIGLGSVNLKKGQLIKAEEHIKQAIDVCGSSESMLITKAGAYQQLADVYAAQKRYSYAKERFIEATEIYKRLGLHRQEAATYRDISMLLDEAEEPEEALSYNDKAIEMYRKRGLEDELLSSLNNSSLILYNSGRFEEARQTLESAISDFDLETSDPTTLAYSYMGIGAIYKRTGNEQLALYNFLKATEILDSVRSKITSGDLRLTFQGRESTLYDAVIKSFFLQGHFEKSLEYVEKAKSRVLIEQIRLARLRKPQLLDDAIGKKEDELLDELNAIIKEGKSGKRAYDADLEIRNLWDMMERSLPASIEIKEYLSLRRADSLKTCEFIELLKNRSNSAILEYYVLKDRLLIFLVNQNSKEPEVYSKEVDKNLLKQKCYNLISTIENRSAESLDMLLSEMSSYILDPVVDALKGLEHIHIVPHSFLHELPIHALPLDGQAMIDRFSISYSHSASVLKY